MVDPPLVANRTAFVPIPPIASHTCEHLFPNLACCSRNQTLYYRDLNNEFLQLQELVGSCPACYQNIWNLWCGLLCNPKQGLYFFPDEQDGNGFLTKATFLIDSNWADGIFNQCKWTLTSNGTHLIYLFPNTMYLFNYLGSMMSFGLTFEMTTTANQGFSAELVNCSDSCNCTQCLASCMDAPAFPPDNPPWESSWIVLWGAQYHIVAAILIFIYGGSWSAFFSVFAVWFAYNKKVPAKLIAVLVGVLGLLAAISLAITVAILVQRGNNSSHCTEEMFGSQWPCAASTLFVVLLGVIVGTPPVVTAILYLSWRMSRTAMVLAEDNKLVNKNLILENDSVSEGILHKFFHKVGLLNATYPKTVIIVCLLVYGLLSVGLMRYRNEESPEKLWVPSSSPAAIDSAKFEEFFGKIPREEIILLVPKAGYDIFSKEVLQEFSAIEEQFLEFSVQIHGIKQDYENICWRPSPNSPCKYYSIFGLWQNNYTNLQSDNLRQHVEFCAENSMDFSCLGVDNLPVELNRILGGISPGNPQQTTALIFTYYLSGEDYLSDLAELWEEKFMELSNTKLENSTIFAKASKSFANEISREISVGLPVAVSAGSAAAVLIFFALWFSRLFSLKFRRFLLSETRFFLALGTILSVAISALAAAGITAVMGLHNTVVMELAIPFCVIVVGFDNIFSLWHSFDHTDPTLHAPIRVAEALGNSGSSMTLSCLSVCGALFLGCWANVPAITNFCVFGGMTIFLEYILQIFFIPALLTLDAYRAEQDRIDCFPCYKLKSDYNPWSGESSKLGLKKHRGAGLLRKFVEKFYGPVVVNPCFKFTVIFLFFLALIFSINFAIQIKIGFDPLDLISKDSFLVKFQQNFNENSPLGPDFYIFADHFHSPSQCEASFASCQNKICGNPGCFSDSLVNYLRAAPSFLFLENNQTWFDGYFDWAGSSACCFTTALGARCWLQNSTIPDGCDMCFPFTENDRPPPGEFYQYFNWFLTTTARPAGLLPGPNPTPDPPCKEFGAKFQGNIAFTNDGRIAASQFRTFHTPVSYTSPEALEILNDIYFVRDQIMQKFGLNVGIYSQFSLENSQFLNFPDQTMKIIGVGLAILFTLTLLLTGNPALSFCAGVVILMGTLSAFAAFKVLGIDLNSISLVLMLFGMGILFDFAIVVIHAYARAEGTQNQRVYRALLESLTPIVGQFIVKFLGIFTLALSPIPVFRHYYFQILASVTIIGFLHSIIFLPVLLSIIGTDSGSVCLPKKFRYKMDGKKTLDLM